VFSGIRGRSFPPEGKAVPRAGRVQRGRQLRETFDISDLCAEPRFHGIGLEIAYRMAVAL
jgi:hypothetical protein